MSQPPPASSRLLASVDQPRLHQAAGWMCILIPIAAAFSRAVADILLVLTCLCFLLHAASTRRIDWLQERWFQIALLLWLYVVLRGFLVEEWASSVGRAASWLRFPLFAIALQYWVIQTPTHSRRLIYSMSLAVGFLILDTALQYLVGTDLLGREPVQSQDILRLTGPYSSPRVGIMIIWMAVPCMAYWLMRPGGGMRSAPQIGLGAFFVVGSLVMIFASGERMAFLLAGLACVLAFFLLRIPRPLMMALALAGAGLLALLAINNETLIRRQLGSTSEVVKELDGSVYGQIWQSSIAMIKTHPVFGVGLRQFRERCPEAAFGATDFDTLDKRCNLHPHNMYLEWWSEAGIIGLGLFITIMGLILYRAIRAFPQLRNHPIFIGLFITLLIRLWPLASTTGFFTSWSAVPFWLVAGWLLALIDREVTHSQVSA